MPTTELAWRSLHDLGLASWFGGSVFGTVALPHTDGPTGAGTRPGTDTGTAAAAVRDVEGDTWKRWSPVVTGSMAAHLVGGAGLLLGNRARHRYQKGVAGTSAVKTALTVTAVALTVGAAAEGYRSQERRRRIAQGADPSVLASQERADRRMRVVGSLIPATTGALVVLGAIEGEQQRPREVLAGVVANAIDSLQGAAERVPSAARDAFQDAAAKIPTSALDAIPGR